MKDQLQLGIFHATKSFLVYKQGTDHRGKRIWNIFKTITCGKSKKQTLADLVWTYVFKKLPAYDFALFERANYLCLSLYFPMQNSHYFPIYVPLPFDLVGCNKGKADVPS